MMWVGSPANAFFLSLAFTECPSISDLIFLAPFRFDESVYFHHMNVTFCKEEKNDIMYT